MHRIKFFRGLSRIPADFMAVLLSWYAAYIIRPYSDLIPSMHLVQNGGFVPELSEYIPVSILSAFGLIAIFIGTNLYSYPAHFASFRVARKVLWAVFLWVLGVLAIYSLVLHELFFSRIMLFHVAIFTIFFVLLFRIFLRILWQRIFILRQKALLIGTNFEKEYFEKNFANSQYEIVMFYNDEKNMQNLAMLQKNISDLKIEDIFLFESEKNSVLQLKLREICAEKGVIFHSIPKYAQNFSGHAYLEIMRGIPVITALPYKTNYWWMAIKRGFDIVFSLFFLVVFSPLLAVIALAIKIDSKGPILYRSERIGRNGKKFTIWKFRSMVENAEDLKEEISEKSHRKGPLFKVKNDPRITQFGKFIRRTSLDETPQFFNVFIGNMSVIGPRPHLENEVKEYTQIQKRVLSVKPGITGLAQISGRSDLSFEDEIFLDTYYAENSSFWLDCKVFIKTPFILLFGRGAD